MKSKAKLIWYKFWSLYHYRFCVIEFERGNYNGAFLHNQKFLEHIAKYIKLGGSEDVLD